MKVFDLQILILRTAVIYWIKRRKLSFFDRIILENRTGFSNFVARQATYILAYYHDKKLKLEL